MLCNLVKKDLLLVKKYLLFMLIFAVGSPIFIANRAGFSGGGFLGFLVTALFMEYILFNTVSMLEEKYKGSALLCATPYTRNTLVKAKYLFAFIIFACTYIIYTIVTLVAPIGMARLNISTFGISLLIITILFGIFVPLQYKFGYEKTRYISFAFIFVSPMLIASIVKWMRYNNVKFQITLPIPQIIQNLLPCLIALVIGFASMMLSMYIYSKKNL